PRHLRLDAAAFLGPRALSDRGLREGGAADASRDARSALHAPVRPAVYARVVRLLAAAFRLWDERLDLSRGGPGAERRVRRVRGTPLRRVQRRPGAAHGPLFHRLSGPDFRRAAGRHLRHPIRETVRFLASLLAAVTLAACRGSGPSFKNTDITGADYGKDFTLTDHTGKKRTLGDFRGKVVVMFFGYARCP